jgi:hypothetical protein
MMVVEPEFAPAFLTGDRGQSYIRNDMRGEEGPGGNAGPFDSAPRLRGSSFKLDGWVYSQEDAS